MFNLIKMNLYRLFHQRAFYIVPVTAAFICCMMVYLIWSLPRLENQSELTEAEPGFHMGIVAGSPEAEALPFTEEFDLTEFMDEILGSGILLILLSVGAAITANAECKNGFIKNLAGQIAPRGMLAVTKLPGMLLESFLILALSFTGCALSGRLLYSDFTPGDISALTKALAVQLLLSFALCTLILMICTLSENAAAGIITGIILCAGITSLVYSLINKVLWNYLHVPESFDITQYTLSGHLMSVSSTSEPDALGLALAVGAAYLAVCSLGAYVILKKKDIA